jgi:hypothetical protein
VGAWTKFQLACAELGPGNAVLYGLQRLFTRLDVSVRIVRYYFVAQPVADKPLLPGRRGKSIDVRQIPENDPALKQFPLDEAVLKFRYGQNAICIGAFKEDRAIGCLWLCLDGYEEDEIRCRFVPTPEDATAWDFDVYVHPDFRTGIVFARLWDEANAFMRERGIQWSMSRISAFNPRSLTSHQSLGARRCGSLLAICVGQWELKLSSLKPRVHWSIGNGAVPQYEIPAPKVN